MSKKIWKFSDGASFVETIIICKKLELGFPKCGLPDVSTFKVDGDTKKFV